MWHMNVYDMTIYDCWTSAKKRHLTPFPQPAPPRYVSLSKSNPTSPGKVSGARFGFGAPNLMHMFNLHVDYWLQICNPHDPILQVVLYILISHSLKAGLWSLVNWLCQLIMGVVGGQTSTRLALGNGGSQPSVGFWGKACPTSSERQYACSILLYIYIYIHYHQRKLGSNLPSYGWLLPVTIHSMKGGVRLWCETWHHITIHSMKGGVRLWFETWHHKTIHSCHGCMIVVIWCCHARREM